MNDIQGFKVKGRHAKLIQAVCGSDNNNHTLIKAVLIGVKEEMKAICADVLDRQSIFLEEGGIVLAPDRQEWPRTRVRKVPQFDYDVAEIFYPKSLNTIVSGNDSTIALHAFPIFQQEYGTHMPLLQEYSAILWGLAQANEYTKERVGIGLPEGERVYTLKFPELEIFEQHLFERMPQIYSLAMKIVK